MRHSKYLSKLIPISLALTLAACSSMHRSRHHDNQPDGRGNGFVHTQGLGDDASSGFTPNAACQPPKAAAYSYYFEFDSNQILPEDLQRLQTIAKQLAQNKLAQNKRSWRVIGNTDDRGSREYNLALGWRRAAAISAVLKQGGISTQHIHTNSNGAEKPIALGNSDTDYQCNRRVDILPF